MNRRHLNFIKQTLLVLLSICLSNCNESKENKEETINKKQYRLDKNEVNIVALKNSTFKKESISNGHLTALEKSELKFNVNEKLKNIYIKNGDYVKKGQLLAGLDSYTFQQKLHKAEIDLKQKTLEFKDLQVRRGFDPGKKETIPEKEYEMMAIKSGYKNAVHQHENARFELQSTKLIAPFSGKVANINTKKHEYINSSKSFLTLINDAIFEVEFYLIESELKDIKVKDKVIIRPLATTKSYQGHITTINPQVEKDGTILIKAQVKNDGDLLEGMNIKVFIQKDIFDQYVVPKSAVVLRDNQEVLFKVINRKAYWTYVQTLYENSKNYAVIPHPDKSSASLKVGDTIIVSDNLNLAHDSEIAIKPNR